MSKSSVQPPSTGRRNLKERAADELRRFAIVSVYLWVCLAALLLYKTALMREEGVGTFALGLALGKALILGKFLLIGEAAGVGSRHGAKTLLHAIVRKAIMLFLLLVALSVLEEILVGWAHGHPLTATLAAFESHSVLEMLAKCVLLLLVLLPLVATTEVNRELGPGVLKGMLLSALPPADTPRRNEAAGE